MEWMVWSLCSAVMFWIYNKHLKVFLTAKLESNKNAFGWWYWCLVSHSPNVASAAVCCSSIHSHYWNGWEMNHTGFLQKQRWQNYRKWFWACRWSAHVTVTCAYFCWLHTIMWVAAARGWGQGSVGRLEPFPVSMWCRYNTRVRPHRCRSIKSFCTKHPEIVLLMNQKVKDIVEPSQARSRNTWEKLLSTRVPTNCTLGKNDSVSRAQEFVCKFFQWKNI